MDRAGGRLTNREIEDAAIGWVLQFEERSGRRAIDRRKDRGFRADIESPPRIIEVKATATNFRGWYLSLLPIQIALALAEPDFFVYVVEHVAPTDPESISVRIIHGELLQRLLLNLAERTSIEVGWPVKDYDAAPPER